MALNKADTLSACESVRMLSQVMRECGVVRLTMASGWAVELHPSAFVAAPVPDAPSEKDADACACGHSLVTEHNPSGCLHGCEVATCNTTR